MSRRTDTAAARLPGFESSVVHCVECRPTDSGPASNRILVKLEFRICPMEQHSPPGPTTSTPGIRRTHAQLTVRDDTSFQKFLLAPGLHNGTEPAEISSGPVHLSLSDTFRRGRAPSGAPHHSATASTIKAIWTKSPPCNALTGSSFHA
jgi:hypothetical protein